MRQIFGDPVLVNEGTGVKPRLGPNGRHVRSCVQVHRLRKSSGTGKCGQFFRVPLIHPAKAPELALHAVEVTVMVRIAGDEEIAADVVVGLHLFDHVDGKWQASDPRRARQLVGHVELGGRRILDHRFRAQIVSTVHQQVRFLPAH